jgi:microcystin-dependent protein
MYPRVPLPGTVGTGDSVSPSVVRYYVTAPNDQWIEKLLLGMLSVYNSSAAFTQMGLVTPDDAATVFAEIYASFNLASDIGVLFPFAGLALPSYALPCDGASYLRSDYPALYAAIGVIWGSVDATHFNVPNLAQSVLGAPGDYGTGAVTVGAQVGELSHTLTPSEMPTHSHSVHQFINTAAGLEVAFASLDTTLPLSSTGSAGGGAPHNNVQLTTVVQWGIVATGR